MSDEGYSSTGGPFFSVVIPSYNSAWSLGAALDSVCAQTCLDFEIIVVDDGSTDETAELARSYPVRYLYQTNAGRAAARNAGIEAARGRWVAFLDADDLWLPAKLAQQQAALGRHHEAVMIYSRAFALADRALLLSSPIAQMNTPRVLGSGRPGCSDCLREFLSGQFDVRTCTVVVRRDALAAIGGFDTHIKISEDWDLFMRLAHYGMIAFDPEPLAVYWVGSFDNRLDRARRYSSHQELRQTVAKNVRLSGIDQRDPAFAGQVVAMADWRCALVEYGLGNEDAARKHTQDALNAAPLFLQSSAAAHILVEHLYDVLSSSSTPGDVQNALTPVVQVVVDSDESRRVLYRKSMGYVFARRAFLAYRMGNPGTGFQNAVRAARFDPTWLRNRGLWTSALRASRLKPGTPELSRSA